VIEDITAVFVLPGFRVLDTEIGGGDLTLVVEITRDLVGCPECGAVTGVKDRRTVTVRDLPAGGTPVIIRWRKRIFECRYSLCERKTWTEHHDAIASRAVLTELARQWGFEQVGFHDRAVSAVAAQLGVAWHTIMTQVTDRGKPFVDDPQRLDIGQPLVETIRELTPGLKIFALSPGHTATLALPLLHHISKPFGVHELRAALASVLTAG